MFSGEQPVRLLHGDLRRDSLWKYTEGISLRVSSLVAWSLWSDASRRASGPSASAWVFTALLQEVFRLPAVAPVSAAHLLSTGDHKHLDKVPG